MTRSEPLDITDNPDLLRLVEEVRRTNTPRVLRRDDEDVAVVTPVTPKRRSGRRVKTEADYQAFVAAGGGWKDLVDTEQLKRDIAASRAQPGRSPIAL